MKNKLIERITRSFAPPARFFAFLFAVCAVSSAWAAGPTAAAVWDGDFTATQTGYSLDRNGNAISADNSTITIDQSVGVKVDFTTGFTSAMTVMFKYSDLAFDAQKTLATSFCSGADENRTGVYLASGGTANGIWNTANWNNPMQTLSESSGVLAFSYSKTAGTALYYISSSSGRTQIYNKSNLKAGDDAAINGCTIGGERAKAGASLLSAATGMKITGIAIFEGVLSESEMTSYVWPSASTYATWDGADDMVAIDPTFSGELASGTSKFNLFDTHAGINLPYTFVGNANTSYYKNSQNAGEVFWHKLSNGSVSGTYNAPGLALLFPAGVTSKTIGGTFGPVTIGGMYVESGATGNSLTQAGNDKRTTIFGDPTGATETFFRFEEPFTVSRTGRFCLSGTINVELPEATDTLTLNKAVDATYAPVLVGGISGLSNDGYVRDENITTGGTLKMHGEGTIEANKLTAIGATLDFSDLGSRANTTPFINCQLVIDADTQFVLPAGVTFPYKVATSISGTAPSTGTYTDPNGNLITGGFTIDAENGTVTVDTASATAITVNGALTISSASAAAITVNAGGTLNANANLTGSLIANGTVNVANGVSIPAIDSTSRGTVVASGNITINGIDDGVIPVVLGVMGTVSFVDSTTTEVLIYQANTQVVSGSIDFSGCTALTTVKVDIGTSRNFLFGSSITYPAGYTLHLITDESLADPETVSINVGSAAPSAVAVTVYKPDGAVNSTASATLEGTMVNITYAPTVFGKATWCDYEMEYESGNASKTGFENTGTDTTSLHEDSSINGDNAFYNGMLYTYAHPWRDISYPADGNWTAVVRCTVPEYENAAVITFGTCNGGLIGLVAGADPETQMKLVKTTGNSAFTVLSTMTVQNATTAQHVYVFEVENNSTIKVYCDGEEVLNETYSAFTLGGGIQVGSVHGGVGNTGIIRFAKNESPANTLSETVQKNARIDCVRLYKSLLGPNAIRQLSVEFPAVKLYRATVADGATTDWDSLAWSPAWDGGNEFSKIILTVEGDATLTLPSSITAEDFKIDVASGHVLTLNKASGGTTFTTTNPMEVDNGTMYLADENSLGDWEIGGTGTVRLPSSAMVTGALSGTAKMEIASGDTVIVTTGSIANTIVGAGALAYPMAIPGALTFGDWTGVVSIPTITASTFDNGINFNNYGKAGSTVQLSAVTGGWISYAGATVAPKLYLVGNMVIDAMSSWTYTFAEIDGAGDLSFSTSENEPTVNITKVAEGYTGTISSTLGNAVKIGTLSRAAGQSTVGGTKLLTTSGQFDVSETAVEIGGVLQSDLVLSCEADGIYVSYAVATAGAGAEVPAASAADAVAQCAVALTAAQKTQGLQESYYKLTATEKESGTWVVTAELNEDVVKVDVAATDMTALAAGSSTTATFTTSNTKAGLYYAIVTVSDPSAASPTVLAEQKATADGAVITLTPTITFGSDAVLYFKWQVSDTQTLTPVTP